MEYKQMTTQNYDSTLDLVKERLKQIDKLKNKFSGFPEVQEKLQNAKDALVESEEEIMTYYDLTKKIKDNKS
jgi:DNA repair ATPase RecN